MTGVPALPVAGRSKAKRIAWSVPQNQFSAPFLKLLREGNRTRTVHPVNPYVEVYRFRDTLYGLLNPNLDGGGDAWSWLTVGPSRALLIGAGFGLGDLPGLARRIAGGKPVLVANAHAGRDQVLGDARFPLAYAHEHDAEAIRAAVRPGAWDALFDAAGKPLWIEFDRADLPRPPIVTRIVPVKDGHVFDLGGGHRVELVWTGGPTPGHAMFLDATNRILFPGDGVGSDTIPCGPGPSPGIANGRYANLTVFRDRLATVIARMDAFDYLFPAHGMVDLENHLLHDLRDTLDAAIARPDAYTRLTGRRAPSGEEYREKYVRGFSSIAYTPGGVRPSAG